MSAAATHLRRVLPIWLTLAASLACTQAAGARVAARTATSLGPAPEACTGANYEFGSCVVQTRLGTLSVSPHVVHAGEVLTATVALTGDYPISWPDVGASPSGSFAPDLTSITPCGAHETTCKWRVAANAASSSSWQFLQVGITNNQGTGISREYFAVIGKDEFELSGRVTEPSGTPVAGVSVTAVGPEHESATTDATGAYSMILKRGSYTVTPSLSKHLFRPAEARVSMTANRTQDFQQVPNVDRVEVSVGAGSLPATGQASTGITITDTNPLGEPVEGETIKVSPPLSYETPALICDSTGRLAYPTLLNDGSALGSSFQRVTDGSGQIHLTALYGTVPGEWAMEAGEPSAPLSQWGHATVSLTPSGGPPTLPEALTSLLISAAEHNLANLAAEPQRNVLAWLGKVQGEIPGIGFLPIHSIDAAGSPQAGVVVYANTPAVREHLLDYLTGHTTLPPDESQAVVIDIASVRELRIGTLLAGHPTDQIPYRLPSLQAWADGTVIQISAQDQGYFGKEAKIPIPARGRPSFGFASPTGAEALLYGYGPYPPIGGEMSEQAIFDRCVSHTFATTITPHSPVTVEVSGGGGSAGLSAQGTASNTISGAIVSHSGKTLRGIALPEGSYTLHVIGTGTGPATLVLAVEGSGGLSTRVFHFRSQRGAHGTIAIHGASVGARMRFGSHTITGASGLALSVHGLPHRIRKGAVAHLRLRLRAAFGGSGQLVDVKVGGVAGRHVASTDSHGEVTLTLKPRGRGRISLSFSGAGYAPLTRTIQVR